MMSSRTRSNSPAPIFSSASLPFTAISTSWPSCFSLRDSRSRFISTSSTTRIRPAAGTLSAVSSGLGGRKQAPQIRQLLLGRALPLLDHVRDLVRVEEVNALAELRNDRKDL